MPPIRTFRSLIRPRVVTLSVEATPTGLLSGIAFGTSGPAALEVSVAPPSPVGMTIGSSCCSPLAVIVSVAVASLPQGAAAE